MERAQRIASDYFSGRSDPYNLATSHFYDFTTERNTSAVTFSDQVLRPFSERLLLRDPNSIVFLIGSITEPREKAVGDVDVVVISHRVTEPENLGGLLNELRVAAEELELRYRIRPVFFTEQSQQVAVVREAGNSHPETLTLVPVHLLLYPSLGEFFLREGKQFVADALGHATVMTPVLDPSIAQTFVALPSSSSILTPFGRLQWDIERLLVSAILTTSALPADVAHALLKKRAMACVRTAIDILLAKEVSSEKARLAQLQQRLGEMGHRLEFESSPVFSDNAGTSLNHYIAGTLVPALSTLVKEERSNSLAEPTYTSTGQGWRALIADTQDSYESRSVREAARKADSAELIEECSFRPLSELRRQVEISPQSASAHTELGFSLLLKNDDALALKALEQAFSLGDRRPIVQLGIAILQERTGALTAAIASATEVLKQLPNSVNAHRAFLKAVAALEKSNAIKDKPSLVETQAIVSAAIRFSSLSSDPHEKRDILIDTILSLQSHGQLDAAEEVERGVWRASPGIIGFSLFAREDLDALEKLERLVALRHELRALDTITWEFLLVQNTAFFAYSLFPPPQPPALPSPLTELSLQVKEPEFSALSRVRKEAHRSMLGVVSFVTMHRRVCELYGGKLELALSYYKQELERSGDGVNAMRAVSRGVGALGPDEIEEIVARSSNSVFNSDESPCAKAYLLFDGGYTRDAWELVKDIALRNGELPGHFKALRIATELLHGSPERTLELLDAPSYLGQGDDSPRYLKARIFLRRITGQRYTKKEGVEKYGSLLKKHSRLMNKERREKFFSSHRGVEGLRALFCGASPMGLYLAEYRINTLLGRYEPAAKALAEGIRHHLGDSDRARGLGLRSRDFTEPPTIEAEIVPAAMRYFEATEYPRSALVDTYDWWLHAPRSITLAALHLFVRGRLGSSEEVRHAIACTNIPRQEDLWLCDERLGEQSCFEDPAVVGVEGLTLCAVVCARYAQIPSALKILLSLSREPRAQLRCLERIICESVNRNEDTQKELCESLCRDLPHELAMFSRGFVAFCHGDSAAATGVFQELWGGLVSQPSSEIKSATAQFLLHGKRLGQEVTYDIEPLLIASMEGDSLTLPLIDGSLSAARELKRYRLVRVLEKERADLVENHRAIIQRIQSLEENQAPFQASVVCDRALASDPLNQEIHHRLLALEQTLQSIQLSRRGIDPTSLFQYNLPESDVDRKRGAEDHLRLCVGFLAEGSLNEALVCAQYALILDPSAIDKIQSQESYSPLFKNPRVRSESDLLFESRSTLQDFWSGNGIDWSSRRIFSSLVDRVKAAVVLCQPSSKPHYLEKMVAESGAEAVQSVMADAASELLEKVSPDERQQFIPRPRPLLPVSPS